MRSKFYFIAAIILCVSVLDAFGGSCPNRILLLGSNGKPRGIYSNERFIGIPVVLSRNFEFDRDVLRDHPLPQATASVFSWAISIFESVPADILLNGSFVDVVYIENHQIRFSSTVNGYGVTVTALEASTTLAQEAAWALVVRATEKLNMQGRILVSYVQTVADLSSLLPEAR